MLHCDQISVLNPPPRMKRSLEWDSERSESEEALYQEKNSPAHFSQTHLNDPTRELHLSKECAELLALVRGILVYSKGV